MISSRTLRYIYEVARCGSIRKAGERLNIAPSAISRQIIAVEEQFGTPLFERMSRRMRPTAAGEVLVAHARDAIQAERQVVKDIDALRGGQGVQCSIATVAGVASDLLAYALTEHRRANADVGFLVQVTTAEAVAASVAVGESDVGFAFDLPRLNRTVVASSARTPCGAVMGPEHPLAHRPQVHLHEIAVYPLLLPRKGVSVRNSLDNAAWRAGIRLHPALESDNFELLHRFVAFDDSIAVLNRVDVLNATREGRSLFRPLIEMRGFTQELAVMHCARSRPSTAAQALMDRLAEVLREIG